MAKGFPLARFRAFPTDKICVLDRGYRCCHTNVSFPAAPDLQLEPGRQLGLPILKVSAGGQQQHTARLQNAGVFRKGLFSPPGAVHSVQGALQPWSHTVQRLQTAVLQMDQKQRLGRPCRAGCPRRRQAGPCCSSPSLHMPRVLTRPQTSACTALLPPVVRERLGVRACSACLATVDSVCVGVPLREQRTSEMSEASTGWYPISAAASANLLLPQPSSSREPDGLCRFRIRSASNPLSPSARIRSNTCPASRSTADTCRQGGTCTTVPLEA